MNDESGGNQPEPQPVFVWIDRRRKSPFPVAPRKRLAAGAFLICVLLAAVGAWTFHLINGRPLVQVVPIPAAAPQVQAAGRFEGNLVMGVAQAAELQVTPEGKEVPPLSEVRGIALSWDGNRVLVTDTGNRTVTIFDRSGKPLKVLGQDGPGKLKGPIAVAEAPDGRIFVVDRLANRLVVFTQDGDFVGDFRPANMPASFGLVPLALAFDRDDNLYLGDGNGYAYIFDQGGNLVRRLVSPDGILEAPTGIAVNASGQVAVTDSSHQRVFVFHKDGTVQGTPGSQGGGGALSLPRGVAMDDQGRAFVADVLAHRVQVYDADGKFLGHFGEEGNLDGQLSYPESVAVDNQGHLYVADRGNKRVQTWRY